METVRKNSRNAASSNSAESGSRTLHCHATTPSNQRIVIPVAHRPKQIQPRGIAKAGRRPILVSE